MRACSDVLAVAFLNPCARPCGPGILDPAVTVSAVVPIISTFVGAGASAVALQYSVLLSATSIIFGWAHARVGRVVEAAKVTDLETPVNITFALGYTYAVWVLGRKLYSFNAGAAQAMSQAISQTMSHVISPS